MPSYNVAKVFRFRGVIKRPGDTIEADGREVADLLKRNFIAKPSTLVVPPKPAAMVAPVVVAKEAEPKPASVAGTEVKPIENAGLYDTRKLAAKP